MSASCYVKTAFHRQTIIKKAPVVCVCFFVVINFALTQSSKVEGRLIKFEWGTCKSCRKSSEASSCNRRQCARSEGGIGGQGRYIRGNATLKCKRKQIWMRFDTKLIGESMRSRSTIAYLRIRVTATSRGVRCDLSCSSGLRWATRCPTALSCLRFGGFSFRTTTLLCFAKYSCKHINKLN